MLLDNYSHCAQQLWNSFCLLRGSRYICAIGAVCWRDSPPLPPTQVFRVIWISLGKSKQQKRLAIREQKLQFCVWKMLGGGVCVHWVGKATHRQPKQRKMYVQRSWGKMPDKRVDWTAHLTKQNKTTDEWREKEKKHFSRWGGLRSAGTKNKLLLFLAGITGNGQASLGGDTILLLSCALQSSGTVILVRTDFLGRSSGSSSWENLLRLLAVDCRKYKKGARRKTTSDAATSISVDALSCVFLGTIQPALFFFFLSFSWDVERGVVKRGATRHPSGPGRS